MKQTALTIALTITPALLAAQQGSQASACSRRESSGRIRNAEVILNSCRCGRAHSLCEIFHTSLTNALETPERLQQLFHGLFSDTRDLGQFGR